MARIPLTLITGYLGTGKTSLLRHLLATANKKLAIVMNEFGALNIDGKVLEGKNVRIAELSGGCVCCSMTGEFELAIKEILEKVQPEWILVETTGVAEPTALASDIVDNLPEVRLDAIITLVDCDALVRFPSLGHTGREQVEMADILLFNKIDLIDGKKLEELQARMREINPRAVFAKSINAKVPPLFLFGLEKDQREKIKMHTSHSIESEVVVYESAAVFDKTKFLRWAKRLPAQVYRAKGFLRTSGQGYLFNYVAGRSDLEPFPGDKTELVFIGDSVLALEPKLKLQLDKCKIIP